MPVYHQIDSPQYQLALWRIEEDLPYFESHFTQAPDIRNIPQKLQWYATRHLMNQLVGEPVSIDKDYNGRPVLSNTTQHISLSHTHYFAAAMHSHNRPVGIDIEIVHPKVVRIAHKFLTEHELSSIKDTERIEKLILYWSAKESLYKLHGKGGLDFKTQLLIDEFELSKSGELSARIVADNFYSDKLTIRYSFFEQHVLTYVVGL